MNISRVYIYIGICMSLLGATHAFAYVASSTNYRLEQDSINVGGLLSSSTNYGLEDTAGEISTGHGTSTNYRLHAGYQQMDPIYITISAPSDVTLLPDIDPAAGGQSDGDATWDVTTNNSGGYTLTLESSTNPAMQGAGTFENYTPVGVPDFTWSVVASAKEFGFTPEGSHITNTYKDNGSACSVGAGNTALACWDSITVAPKTIASSASSNHPAGTLTTVYFRAEAGAASGVSSGTYSAIVILTAMVQ